MCQDKLDARVHAGNPGVAFRLKTAETAQYAASERYTLRQHRCQRQRLARVVLARTRVPVPLVLHGASGLSDESLHAAAGRGIAKVNFNTELRAAYCDALARALPEAARGLDVAALMREATTAVQRVVEAKLRMLGAADRISA